MSEIKTWEARLLEAGLNDWPDPKPYMQEEITELRAALAERDGTILALKRGNTVLIDSLMGMVDQFFRDDGDGNLSHRCMSAEEYAIKTLLEAGFAEEVNGDYRLLWAKIEEREKAIRDHTRACAKEDRAITEREWQPIETAPNGVAINGEPGVCWMMLAIPDGEGSYIRQNGMRIGDRFFAALTFYCGGKFEGKQFELRESEVKPTHWMPLPEPPIDAMRDGGVE